MLWLLIGGVSQVFALRDEIERHVQGIELLDERIMDQEMELDTTAKLRVRLRDWFCRFFISVCL